MSTSPPDRAGARAWLVWLLAAAAFGFAFFQRVAPSVMVNDLMAEFAVGGAVLGQLSALYFYTYAGLQIPLGALLDRYGPRLLLTGGLVLAAGGSALFGLATSIEAAYAGRLAIGAGTAVGFLASLGLAARWFPARRYAAMTGLTMFVAMLSGIGAQAPLAIMVEAFGWRATMMAGAIFAGVLALAVAVFVRNSPQRSDGGTQRGPLQSWAGLWHNLGLAARNRHVWMLAIVATAMSGTMLAFGGLWGVPYIMAAYHMARPDAAFLTSLILAGWAVGAPLIGWLSDRMARRKLPVVAGAAIHTTLVAVIILLPGMPVVALGAVLFATGLSGAGMVTTFALGRELSSPRTHGSVTGIINATTVASGAVLQPFTGLLLDWQWDGTLADGARIYQVSDYQVAFVGLLCWSAAGFVFSLLLPETRGRVKHGPQLTP